jgi:hypothetical protein
VAVAAALLAVAPSGRADDVAEARAHFRTATELYRAGRYRDAAAEFEAAYRVKPAGAIHFNVAQCRERLGELPSALRSYHEYLREVPDAKDRPAVRAAMQRASEKLAASGVQALLVDSDPPGAEVRIDGRARGRTPFVIALPAGAYEVAVARDGYAEGRRGVTLGLDGYQDLDLTLAPEGARASGASAPPAPVAAGPAAPVPAVAAGPAAPVATVAAGLAAPAPPDAARPASPQPAPPDARPDLSPRLPAPALPPAAPPPPPAARSRVWTWVAAGTAVAAAGAGAYFGVTARQKSQQLTDGTVHSNAAALASDAKRSAQRANVAYGIAAAAGAAGVTLFFVEGRF